MRNICDIAAEIGEDWPRVREDSFHPASDLWKVMNILHSINDFYGADSAKEIINRFLSNAGGWRGDNAKRIKAELREAVK